MKIYRVDYHISQHFSYLAYSKAVAIFFQNIKLMRNRFFNFSYLRKSHETENVLKTLFTFDSTLHTRNTAVIFSNGKSCKELSG